MSLTSRKPDMYIGGEYNPYLLRWYIIPRNRFFNVYLHCFMRDDDDRALHDHPWSFVSILLKGRYTEIVRDDHHGEERGMFRCPSCNNDQPAHIRHCANCGRPKTLAIQRRRFSVAFRRAKHRHRVLLPKDINGTPIPCWTLLLTGPVVRQWGFWCIRGWVHWKRFTSFDETGDSSRIGRGCD